VPAVIVKGVSNFAYTQYTESTALVCSLPSAWRVIAGVSGKVLLIGETVICCPSVGIGFGVDWHSEECFHSQEIVWWQLSNNCQDVRSLKICVHNSHSCIGHRCISTTSPMSAKTRRELPLLSPTLPVAISMVWLLRLQLGFVHWIWL